MFPVVLGGKIASAGVHHKRLQNYEFVKNLTSDVVVNPKPKDWTGTKQNYNELINATSQWWRTKQFIGRKACFARPLDQACHRDEKRAAQALTKQVFQSHHVNNKLYPY